MKVALQLVMLKLYSISLIPSFIIDFKQNLGIRNGWQQLHVFVPMEVSFLPLSYLRVRSYQINGYLLTSIKLGGLPVI